MAAAGTNKTSGSHARHESDDPCLEGKDGSFSQYLQSSKPPHPDDALLTQYYERLLERNPNPVKVVIDPQTKQKSVHATREIQPGETVLSNEPLISMLHSTSQELLDACERCHRILGDAESQIRRLTTVYTPSPQEEGEETNRIELLDSDFQFPSDALKDPSELQFCSSQCRCRFGCGTLYCSPECRAKAWKEYHRQLCPNAYNMSEERVTTAMLFGEAIPEEDIDQGNKSCIYQVSGHVSSDGTSFNLVSLFNRQAEATNEIFKMAGKVYANVLSRWRDNGKDMDDAMMPFLAFHQRPWWEVVLQGMDESEKNDEDFYPQEVVKSLKESMLEALHILHSILITSAPADLPVPEEQDRSKLFNLDTFANLIGAFEMNNISVEIDNPLRDLLVCLSLVQDDELRRKVQYHLQPALKAVAIAQKARTYLKTDEHESASDDEDSDGDEVSDEDEITTNIHTAVEWARNAVTLSENVSPDTVQELIPHGDGTSIMPLTCAINHSCLPNSTVSYCTGNRIAVVQAIQPLDKDDEVFICYVDEHADYEQRYAELRHYDFECQCKRCQEKL